MECRRRGLYHASMKMKRATARRGAVARSGGEKFTFESGKEVFRQGIVKAVRGGAHGGYEPAGLKLMANRQRGVLTALTS